MHFIEPIGSQFELVIRNAGEEPAVTDYLKTPSNRTTLKRLIDALGLPMRDVLRQKGTPCDELGLDDPKWTDDQLIDFMLQHPILMNRPIVVTPIASRMCRPAEDVLDILPRAQLGAFTKEDGQAVINHKGERVAKT